MNLNKFIEKRYLKSSVLICADAVMLGISFISSCYLSNYDLSMLGVEWFILLPIIIIVQLVVFLRFGLHRAILRYASVDSVIIIFKAVTTSIIVFVLGLYLIQKQLPIKVLLLYWLLTICFIGGSRFFVRYYFELKLRYQKGRRVLIYGAGDMGVLAFKQLNMNKAIFYSPIGFLDDDPTKKGKIINSIKVLGGIEELDNAIDKFKIEEVLVAVADLSSDKLSSIVKGCRQNDVVCRIIPCFSRLLDIEPQIRNVELADLMRRSPKDLDKEAIKEYLEQKTILITGAAGSIGSELARQCLKYNPKLVLALDQSEHGLYLLNEEFNGSNIVYLLRDATDRSRLEGVFNGYHPEIVFHAAAYKHVPMLEFNPVEAIRNNIGSTKELCELSAKHNVKSFVMISTDKAVRPSSVMGATKRVCELIVQNFDAKSKTEFIAVRFGNVLGSSGSVIPKFIEQIRKGGPVTVTHPDATRFFMLIDEAVQLVLQAATIGKGGEIFILDMGKPVRIAEMAEDLIYLMGRQPHKDIKIEYAGLRPGEKVHEELFSDEIERRTRFSEITIGKPKVVNWEWLNRHVDELLSCVSHGSSDAVLNIMKTLVPEGNFGKRQTTQTKKANEQGDEIYATELQ